MRRLCIFVHWDRDNTIDTYIITYIQGLQTIAADIIFVSNCPINEEEKIKIKPFVSSIVVRENKGLDFGAWKEVILSHGLSSIAETYDELVLANSSCFAPLFPFQEMFDAMKAKCCDFWGITENKAPYLIKENGAKIPILPHIQSYFLVFNKKIMESAIFNQFWLEFNSTHQKDDVILYGETKLTDLLLRANFKSAVYLPAEKSYDYSVLSWDYLIKQRCPVLKVKIFSIFMNNRFDRLITLFRYQEIIKKNGSQYDCEIIESHLKKCCPGYSKAFFRYKNHRFIFLFIWLPYKWLRDLLARTRKIIKNSFRF